MPFMPGTSGMGGPGGGGFLTKRVYPRSDFPQDGWLGVANRAAVPPWTPAFVAESQSFLMPPRTRRLDTWRSSWSPEEGWLSVKPRADVPPQAPAWIAQSNVFRLPPGRNRRLDTWRSSWSPEEGWIGLKDRQDVPTWTPTWDAEMKVFRTPARRTLDLWRSMWSPEEGWISVQARSDVITTMSAAVAQLVNSYRLPRQASQMGREPWKIRVSPIQGGLVELFPATWAMIPDVFRLPKRKWPTAVPIGTDWITAILATFDPAVLGWHQPTERRWERDRRARQTEPQAIWMPVPVYDPQLFPSVIPLGGLMSGRDRRPRATELQASWMPVPVYDSALWPGTVTMGDRLRGRDAKPRFSEWMPSYLPVPVYDPALFIATTQALFRMLGRDRRPRGLDPLAGSLVPASIFDPALFPTALFDRLRGRDSRPRLSEMGGPGLPIFDPAFFPTLLAESLRARRRGLPLGEVMAGLTPPAVAFDPALFQPILAELIRARRRGFPLGDVALGLVPPAPTFDPAFWPAIEALLRVERQRGRPAFPWWATDFNWVEGIEEAPAVVITPPQSPQGRPAPLARRFDLIRWDEEILLFLRRNLRP